MKYEKRHYKVNCREHGYVRAYVARYRGRLMKRCRVCVRTNAYLMYHRVPAFREKNLLRSREWKKAHPEKVKEYRANPLTRENQRIYFRLYRERNRDRINAARRIDYALRRYGVPTLPSRKGRGGRMAHGGKDKSQVSATGV